MADSRGIQNAKRTGAESTEPYRGPVRDISTVERWTRPAPTKKRSVRQTATDAPSLQRAASILSRSQTSSLAAQAGHTAKLGRKSGFMLRVVGFTAKVYMIQIAFGLITLFGVATLGGLDTSSILSATDLVTFGSVKNLGAAIFLVGIVGAMLCGFITYLMTAPFFGKKNMAALSPIILAVCLVGLLCPVLNLFPLMWGWCLYMALAAGEA